MTIQSEKVRHGRKSKAQEKMETDLESKKVDLEVLLNRQIDLNSEIQSKKSEICLIGECLKYFN